MKNVLLALSTSGTDDAVIAYAVGRAKKDGAGLVALYILDLDLANSVFDNFTDIGFIGDKPSSELSEAIMKEYRQRGYEELGRVQVKAMEEAVPFEPLMEQGNYVEKTLAIIVDRKVSTAVLVKHKQRSLYKYFTISHADEVKKAANCEVVIFVEKG